MSLPRKIFEKLGIAPDYSRIEDTHRLISPDFLTRPVKPNPLKAVVKKVGNEASFFATAIQKSLGPHDDNK